MDHGDKTLVEYLNTWEQIRKEKIKKMTRTHEEKVMKEVTGKPNREAAEYSNKLLETKNPELEKMKVEDRLFKRAAEQLKNYRGVEIPASENPTFRPVINKNSEKLVKSKRDTDIFESLYQ